MAKKFTFDDAITTDIKGAASDSYIDNIKMIKMTDIETNSENFYSLPDIEELAEDIERQGLIHSLAVTKTSYGTYKLISGHRRLSAIKLLSEKGKWNSGTVPCYVITAKKSEAEMNLDLIMLNHTQRKYSDADIFKEHEELKKIFTQLEADGVEIKGRLREKIAKAMHVSSAQIGKIENIKNNAIDSVKVAVENGELSISTANEIAKHNATKQQEIISSPIEKIKTADVRNINRDISDKLCRKYGVSVISTQSEFKPIDQTTMQLALKQKSWKIQLLSDLDDAKEKCRSKSEFISFFKSRNYEIRYEKHITIRKIGEKKAIRVDTLAKQFGNQYTKAELEKAMGYSTNLADTNTNNVNLQSKKTCARKNINEWQRFESWSFSQKNRYANNYRCLKKQYGTTQKRKIAEATKNPVLICLIFNVIMIDKRNEKCYNKVGEIYSPTFYIK